MANKYQEEILNAISYLVDNKISSIDRDKTITATVVTVNNALTGEYKVSYNGGTITAYAQDGTSYTKDSTVFVLVPEGNFSKKKTILGLATSTSSDSNVSFVSSLVNDYNKLGENCLSSSSADGKKTRWGLCSYLKEDYVLLYQHGHEDSSFITINDSDFATYIKQAEALLLQGNFQTALPRAHRTDNSGKYGVSFTFAFQDGDAQVEKYSYENIAKIAVADNDFEIDEDDFCLDLSNADHVSFLAAFLEAKREIDYLWEDKNTTNITSVLTGQNGIAHKASALGISIDSYKKSIQDAVSAYEAYADKRTSSYNDYEVSNASAAASANLLAHCVRYVQDNPSQYDSTEKKTSFETAFSYVAKDTTYQSNAALKSLLEDFTKDVVSATEETWQDDVVAKLVPQIKYISYTIDSTNMLGSPMNYSSVTTQYNIYQIDSANFLYIDSILLFSQDFVQEDDKLKAYGNSGEKNNNIFFSDFAAYGLKTISSTNGDYSLRLSTPQGSIFKSLSKQEKDAKAVVGKLTNLQTDLSDSTSFSWFAKDDRVSSTSEQYRVTAGSGYRYLEDKGSTKTLTLLPSENRAYENKYLCVANYRDSMILKTDFTIYNEACQREILVSSNFPDNEFSFDRGNPILTCTIDGKSEGFEEGKDANHHDDSLFSFYWSVTDANGNTTTLSKTVAQLKSEYEQALKADGTAYSTLMSLKNQMTKLEGVSWDKNVLTYPVKQIDSLATFSCSVFLRDAEQEDEYFIGSSSVTLKNTTIADPVDYTIRITNGDQVFQYSESGVTPASERNTDPQKILPLQCRFFDKNGLEVNTSTYDVRWRVPLSDTMIVAPTEGMKTNPATLLDEWYVATPYPLDIAESYDYQATHNQVTCIVTYQGEEYSQDTSLSFSKIGDNGTNGTDVVAKISPTSSPQGGLLALEIVEGETEEGTIYAKEVTTNKGSLESNPLTFNLYRRSEALNPTSVIWSVAPTSSKARNLTVDGGTLGWNTPSEETIQESRLMENLIVKAVTTFDASEAIDTDDDENQATAENTSATSSRQTYNAFYPVPIINHGQKKTLYVKILRDETLKQVLYNADGRNPMYNKKQGVYIEVTDANGKPIDDRECSVTWTVRGGKDQSANTSTLRLSKTEEGKFDNGSVEIEQTNKSSIVTDNADGTTTEQTTYSDSSYRIYAIPADTYSGEYMNQIIEGKIYVDGSLGCTVTIPVYLSLNSYGLASLNAWDGNHIEINEDGNYILAPQIGAGYKGKDPNDKTVDNVFTGIVMGQAKTYDSDDTSTGLLGYSGGKQSIWLDAESGKAVFGLPSDAGSQANGYNEGRIKLIPGGNSQIGNWTIGSNAIYAARQLTSDGSWNGPQSDDDVSIANQLNLAYTEKVVNASGKVEEITPLKTEYKGTGKNSDGTSVNYLVDESSVAIPYDMQGAILSAFPAYLSLKGKPLDENNSSIAWGDANTVLQKGDSLEVEIDPGKSSLFSIYRHTCYNGDERQYYDKAETKPKYRRYPLVGINANGQFYTNAVENGESSMGIGSIGAFGDSAATDKYIGGQFATSGNNILKFFVDADTSTDETAPVYLSMGTKVSNEYPRDVNLYGKSLNLYSADIKTDTAESLTKSTSAHFLKVGGPTVTLGHQAEKTTGTIADNYLSLSSDVTRGGNNVLKLDTAPVDVTLGSSLTSNIAGTVSSTVSGDVTKAFDGNLTTTIGHLEQDANGDYTRVVGGVENKTVRKSSYVSWGKVNDQALVHLHVGDDDESLQDGNVPFCLSKLTTSIKTTDKNGTTTNLAVSSGFSIDSTGAASLTSQQGMTIFNNNAGALNPLTIASQGPGAMINIGAIQKNDNTDDETLEPTNWAANHSAYLKLKASGDDYTWFNLNSQKGQVYTTKDLQIGYPYRGNNDIGWATAKSVNGVVVDPLLYTPGVGIFAGSWSTGNGGALYDCSVYAQNGVIAKKFIMFPDNSSDDRYQYQSWGGSGYGNDLTGESANDVLEVLKHLQAVCDKLGEKCSDLQNQHDSLVNTFNRHTHSYSRPTSASSSSTTRLSADNGSAGAMHVLGGDSISLSSSGYYLKSTGASDKTPSSVTYGHIITSDSYSIYAINRGYSAETSTSTSLGGLTSYSTGTPQ
jgi:hypothetical protein